MGYDKTPDIMLEVPVGSYAFFIMPLFYASSFNTFSFFLRSDIVFL